MDTDLAEAVREAGADFEVASKGASASRSDAWIGSISTSTFCVDAWTADHAWESAELRARERQDRKRAELTANAA